MQNYRPLSTPKLAFLRELKADTQPAEHDLLAWRDDVKLKFIESAYGITKDRPDAVVFQRIISDDPKATLDCVRWIFALADKTETTLFTLPALDSQYSLGTFSNNPVNRLKKLSEKFGFKPLSESSREKLRHFEKPDSDAMERAPLPQDS